MCFYGIIDYLIFRVCGGRKNLDTSPRAGGQFWILIYLESAGKIKGHV